ncbi:hypothetical protein HAX54_017339 [Datura stramonium]|uniref:Uncharacterized protein n=1 Tax=Datura stramonium TaxID=4076 RepID=A0ABS8ULT5_DATST|nr:hypothetical protein [Datura stramonium]
MMEIQHHSSAKINLKKCLFSKALRPTMRSMASLKIKEGIIMLQFRSFEPIEVSTMKKISKASKCVGENSRAQQCSMEALQQPKHSRTDKSKANDPSKCHRTTSNLACGLWLGSLWPKEMEEG